jgi:hypothetical protein
MDYNESFESVCVYVRSVALQIPDKGVLFVRMPLDGITREQDEYFLRLLTQINLTDYTRNYILRDSIRVLTRA